MEQRTFVECLRYNIEHNWDEGGLFESMTKDDCIKACDRIEQLETEVKSQTEHIKLLNQCDDSSTEVIGKMDDEIRILKDVIERQKQTIRNQGAGCEKRHNVLCGVKEVIDEYYGDIKWLTIKKF